jgi:uncharacterized membrane protein (DUF373 family)
MKQLRRRWQHLPGEDSNQKFLSILKAIEGIVSVVLSLAMVIVIFVVLADLVAFLFNDLLISPIGRFGTNLFTIFGLFLNVLIALEILENITAYLRKHVIQVELVIATSLIAVARKIIILDLEKTEGINLIALAATIISLSVSYWFIRRSNRMNPPSH